MCSMISARPTVAIRPATRRSMSAVCAAAPRPVRSLHLGFSDTKEKLRLHYGRTHFMGLVTCIFYRHLCYMAVVIVARVLMSRPQRVVDCLSSYKTR
jgi:hypothetical protein